LLLNKAGKLLREEPTLGRAIAMKEFIFLDGVNVRKLIDAVELFNYLKKKIVAIVRIILVQLVNR